MRRLLLILACLAIALPVYAWDGKCVNVADGDTITVLHEGRPEKIRLFGVDCPEKSQPWGNEATAFTESKTLGLVVSVQPVEQDRYGRTVAWVGELNHDLVAAGLAWHYRKYAPKEADLYRLERGAREQRRGLWSDNPVPPWEWRRGRRR